MTTVPPRTTFRPSTRIAGTCAARFIGASLPPGVAAAVGFEHGLRRRTRGPRPCRVGIGRGRDGDQDVRRPLLHGPGQYGRRHRRGRPHGPPVAGGLQGGTHQTTCPADGLHRSPDEGVRLRRTGRHPDRHDAAGVGGRWRGLRLLPPVKAAKPGSRSPASRSRDHGASIGAKVVFVSQLGASRTRPASWLARSSTTR